MKERNIISSELQVLYEKYRFTKINYIFINEMFADLQLIVGAFKSE